MARSELDIWNQALEGMSHSAVTGLQERSTEADLCRTFYPQSRDELLEDFDWEFARAVVTLTLLDNSEAVDSWTQAYAYPDKCLRVRRIVNPYNVSAVQGGTAHLWPAGGRYADDPDYRYAYGPAAAADDNVHFEVMLRNDTDQGKKILTNLPDARARITIEREDPSVFTSQFVRALTKKLQAYLIPVLAKTMPIGDRVQASEQMLQAAQSIAQRATLEESAPRPNPTPRRVAARG